MFLVSGADKADMVGQVLRDHSPPYPAQLVQPPDGKLMWMLDEAAATKLSQ
jgi:6-phosphogluconolactonase